MGRANRSKPNRHNPLLQELLEDDSLPQKNRQKFVLREQQREVKDDPYVSATLSKKILKIASEQQKELAQEDTATVANTTHELDNGGQYHNSNGATSEYNDDEALVMSDQEFDEDYDGLDIAEADREAMDKFLPEAPGARQTLADIIMAKIDEYNEKKAPGGANGESQGPRVHPKVREVYTKVGVILSRYKSGMLPKAFKIIPTIPQWEEMIHLTRPEDWSANATYEAIKLFVPSMSPKKVAKILEFILLDKVREDIQRNKKLNYHLYMALKKALFRPEAFFKGIVFPLCKTQSCTLREAVIISSVINKVSIPALHSGSALLKIADMDYSGPNSLFLRVLLDKKYALPYKVVDGLVFHFLRFKADQRELPVLWHQALLTFVQRYKSDLTPDQKDALLDLLKYQFHESISPEVRREIVSSTCRGEMMTTEEAGMDMSL
ncbi:snoRNA-binding rRNA-processing protein [Dispira simplex]|nr:snoRNA-binding rRNA-processing protein [Dispira simplex]